LHQTPLCTLAVSGCCRTCHACMQLDLQLQMLFASRCSQPPTHASVPSSASLLRRYFNHMLACTLSPVLPSQPPTCPFHSPDAPVPPIPPHTLLPPTGPAEHPHRPRQGGRDGCPYPGRHRQRQGQRPVHC
jgi:hypothetical protein